MSPVASESSKILIFVGRVADSFASGVPVFSPAPWSRSSLWVSNRSQVSDYFDSASIFSITKAREPPRSKTFPLAVTFCPAKGNSFSFWLLEGVVSAMGQ